MTHKLTWTNTLTPYQPSFASTGFGSGAIGDGGDFTLEMIADGAAYRLTSPFPGHPREYFRTTAEQARQLAQELYDEFLQDCRQALTRDPGMQCYGNATEFTFPDAVRTHACPAPCDPRDTEHQYNAEPITVRRVAATDHWTVQRPDGSSPKPTTTNPDNQVHACTCLTRPETEHDPS